MKQSTVVYVHLHFHSDTPTFCPLHTEKASGNTSHTLSICCSLHWWHLNAKLSFPVGTQNYNHLQNIIRNIFVITRRYNEFQIIMQFYLLLSTYNCFAFITKLMAMERTVMVIWFHRKLFASLKFKLITKMEHSKRMRCINYKT